MIILLPIFLFCGQVYAWPTSSVGNQNEQQLMLLDLNAFLKALNEAKIVQEEPQNGYPSMDAMRRQNGFQMTSPQPQWQQHGSSEINPIPTSAVQGQPKHHINHQRPGAQNGKDVHEELKVSFICHGPSCQALFTWCDGKKVHVKQEWKLVELLSLKILSDIFALKV